MWLDKFIVPALLSIIRLLSVFEYSAPDAITSIVQEALLLVIEMFVPAIRVILSCLEFKAFCKLFILDTTRLLAGNETEPFTNKSDILQDDEWIVLLCKVDIFEKDPSPLS